MKELSVKIFYKKYAKYIFIFISFIGAYLLFPNFYEANIYPIIDNKDELWKSLDQSWMLTLNYCNISNLNWGNEIVFTYGPLAFLSTKVGWGINKYFFLIYDIYFFFNFFFIFYIIFKESKSFILPLIVLISTILVYPVWVGSMNAFILLGFLVFWINYSLDNIKLLIYINQITLVILMFFIKFNTGLIAIPLFIIGVLYNFIKNKEKRRFLILLTFLLILLTFLFGKLLNVSIFSYVKNGLEIIKGYNDVMYYEHLFKNKLLAILIVASVFIIYIWDFFRKTKINYYLRWSQIILFMIPFFVLFKQGFVRGLEEDFFILTPFLILNLKETYNYEIKQFKTIFLFIPIITTFFYLNNLTDSKIHLPKFSKKDYFIGLNNFTANSGLHLYPNENILPPEVLNEIKNKSVDVFPWNIQLLFENNLNYKPRPVPQTYTTYTLNLENLNFEYYNDHSKAPDYVLYEIGYLDYRFAYFDDMKLQVVFEKNYAIFKKFKFKDREMLLLKKKSNFQKINFQKINEYAILINDSFSPKKDIYYSFEIYNNFKGKIYSVLKYSPEINLEITSQKGEFLSYRSSKELAKIGLYSNNLIKNLDDFEKLKKSNTDSLDKIKSYKLNPFSNKYFKEKIKVTEYKITQ